MTSYMKIPAGVPWSPADLWVGGFQLTDGHLVLLCLSWGLLWDQIDHDNPLPHANECVKKWDKEADIIEMSVKYRDGTIRDDYLLILRIDTPRVGEEPDVEWLKNREPGSHEVLDSLFSPEFF